MVHEDPKTIGRYKVLEALGAGAMGAVYLCHDPLLKRKVAVKIVLNSHSDSEAMLTRFQRESEISAQLNHPNIISIFDVGNDELIGPFLTMEFVDGSSLGKLLQTQSPVDPKLALNWICQMGQALVAAENAGVVHRDIKPENVLVGKNGRLKLTDFGLARNEDSNLTTTGVVMGTPSYTAPELLAGTPASPITDRWAFAVTVFQILTGNNLPHRGDTIAALLHHIAHSQPILPKEMSAPLQRIFLKALHKDPTRRYDSILSFIDAISDALGMKDFFDSRGLSLVPPTPGSQAGNWSTQNIPKTGSGLGEAQTTRSPVPGAGSGSGERRATPPPAQASKLTAPPTDLFHDVEPTQGFPTTHLISATRVSPSPGAWASHSHSPKKTFISSSKTKSDPQTGLFTAAALLGLLVMGYFGIPRSVRIESVPPGAEITVDNQPLGITPLESRFFFGTHVAKAKLDGYWEEFQTFNAKDERLAFDLKSKLAWIDITTNPAGAYVVLGSRHLGNTPLKEVMVPLNPEKVVITLNGYRRWEGILGPANPLPATIKLVKVEADR